MHKNYHFIGIGGIGMGTLASLVISKGGNVTGSDVKENNMTKCLREKGAKVVIGHDKNNVGSADCIVYSSAIKDDNPEIIEARQRKIPIIQRGALLSQIMENHIAITVAGMHGKTTTTSMISNLLIQAGLKPTTAVGGIIQGNVSNAALGQGKYFVAEVDESDGSFLFFHPTYSIITNIDFEHVDYYQNWEKIIETYDKFIHQTSPDGLIIGCGDNLPLRELLLKSGRKYSLYGIGSENDAFAKNIYQNGYQTKFDAFFKKEHLGLVELKVPGEHNIVNALACITLGLSLGIDFKVIQQSLLSFNGVQRRLQNKGIIKGIQIVDDYGHHPTEIAASLKAVKSFMHKRIITVFQPHRYSRTKYLLDEFVESLSLSDYVVITDIYAASEPSIEGISAEVLYKKFIEKGESTGIYLKKQDILRHLLEIAEPGDLVLTLGAGDIYHIGDEFISALEKSKERVNLHK